MSTDIKFLYAEYLPENLPITTPLTLAFIGTDLVLAKKKEGFWDILGGKLKDGENWKEALVRESIEEAGVEIENIKVIGYYSVINSSHNSKFPRESIMPVTISFVKKIIKNRKKFETIDRGLFRKLDVEKLFAERKDNLLMNQIYNFAYSYIKTLKINFEFEIDCKNDIPTTQVMVFCKNKEEKFCVVRDHNENHFSLPGGGCELNEDDYACAKRELLEEAQITPENLNIIGAVVVTMFDNDKVMNKFKQVRMFCNCTNEADFIPRLNGFETLERKFIPLNELKKEIPLLNNPSGDIMLGIIKTK